MERSRDLKSLREGAGAVRGTFSGFRDFVATFRALCTLTRIETARLGGAGADFGSLTEDVESLAESMGAKAENVLEAAILLDQRVQDTFAKLSDVDVLLKDLSLVIAGVMGSLDDFSNQQAAAVALSTRLVSDCNSAAASIKDAVMSIQFHDITRQQVEHVIDALGQVQAENRDRPSCLSREATAALALEASQLADAEKKFTVSVARLSDDLGNIAACVREMAGNGRGLLHASGNEQESFFLKMEECLTVILNAALAVSTWRRTPPGRQPASWMQRWNPCGMPPEESARSIFSCYGSRSTPVCRPPTSEPRERRSTYSPSRCRTWR